MKILFLCVENAGRSQMAEGFARAIAPPGAKIFSAGSLPAERLNPAAIEAMWERGIDISGQTPKGLATLPEDLFDMVVGMGCADACPAHRAKRAVTWEIPDPKGQPMETVRQIRDQIETQVKKLFSEC